MVSQSAFSFVSDLTLQPTVGLPEAFKRLYYHLYTNSKASRAETIIEDLSLILLAKLAVETNGGKQAINSFANGKSTANRILLPLLRETYPNLIDNRQQFTLEDEAIRTALSDLSSTTLSEAPSHSIGEAFQALLGPRLRGEMGQFFTPLSVVRTMVEILSPTAEEHVLDPACGTGGFLTETYRYISQQQESAKYNYKLFGIDKDRGLSRLATALLQITVPNNVRIGNFNSLDFNAWETNFHDKLEGRFDVVLTNPPFGAKIGVREKQILSSFDFGHQWVRNEQLNSWHKVADELVASQDPQILFLELCVRALKPGGRMGVVLPEGVFGNKNTSYIWNWLEDRGHIMALLDCPRTTFQPGTDTKTDILFFRKHGIKSSYKDKVFTTSIGVALHCGHDRRGRSTLADGSRHPDDFPTLATSYHTKHAGKRLWHSVNLSGKRYLVPRYYIDQGSLSAKETELIQGANILPLGDLIREGIVTIRKGHEVGSNAYGTGDVPFVRTSDISNFEISTDPTKSVSQEVYECYANQQDLKAGDVIMVVDGRYRIGASAILTENNCHCVIQSHLRIFGTPRQDILDPYELLYALTLPSVKLRIRNLVFIQSTLGTLGNRLLELKIPVLHGRGPWSEKIVEFRDRLIQRDILLTKLKTDNQADFEI